MEEEKKSMSLEEAKNVMQAEMQARVKEFGEELDKLQKRLRCNLAIVVPSQNNKIPIDHILKLPVVIEIIPLP